MQCLFFRLHRRNPTPRVPRPQRTVLGIRRSYQIVLPTRRGARADAGVIFWYGIGPISDSIPHTFYGNRRLVSASLVSLPYASTVYYGWPRRLGARLSTRTASMPLFIHPRSLPPPLSVSAVSFSRNCDYRVARRLASYCRSNYQHHSARPRRGVESPLPHRRLQGLLRAQSITFIYRPTRRQDDESPRSSARAVNGRGKKLQAKDDRIFHGSAGFVLSIPINSVCRISRPLLPFLR